MTVKKLLSPEILQFLNDRLENATPEEILQWAYVTIPNTCQTSALGLSGLIILHMTHNLMKSRNKGLIPKPTIVFYDTLYHFPETLKLLSSLRTKYDEFNWKVFQPKDCETVADFEEKYGNELWKNDQSYYDYLVKVEPSIRSVESLDINAMITGRRRSQGKSRTSLPIIELDEDGVLKINPLASWTFEDVKDYVEKNNLERNDLISKGYKSIGDWHSTVPVSETDDERSGRWKGQEKTECGLHEKSKYFQYLQANS